MATNESIRTALARPAEQTPPAQLDVRGKIELMRPQFERVIGDTVGVERFVRIALTELRHSPKLLRCKEESILGALMTCAQLNLEPGRALGEAWLVPYGDECTFIVGYKGLLKLAWQSGKLVSFVAQTVRDGDRFDFAYGLDPYLTHKPPPSGRGDAIAWYAAARLVGGGSAFEVLYREDVERIRARSRAKDDGPWRTDYDAMAKKTAIRQLAKFLPMSVQFNAAVAHDESVRTDTTPDAFDARVWSEPDPVTENLPL